MRTAGFIVKRVIIPIIVTAACGTAQDLTASSPDALSAVHHEKRPDECITRTAEDFVTKTRSERAAEAYRSLVSPTPYFFIAVRAGIDQGFHRPKEWDRHAEGYALRYGSIFGEYFISQTFEQAVAYKFHEDNQYFASGRRNPARRFGYAVSSALLARHDDGSRSLSISVIGGAATAAFVSRAWQPRSTTTAADAAVSFGLTMATRMGINVLREFSPRFFGRFLP